MINATRALRQPLSLRLVTVFFVTFWALLALFPLFWIGVMSFRLPVDAFAANPLQVLFGTITQREVGGFSLIHLVLVAVTLIAFYKAPGLYARHIAKRPTPARRRWLTAAFFYPLAAVVAWYILPMVADAIAWLISPIPLVNQLATPVGLTTQHYEAVWVDNGFYKNFVNSLIVTAGVVTISYHFHFEMTVLIQGCRQSD